MRATLLLIALAAAIAPEPAAASASCRALRVPLTQGIRAAEAARVTREAGQRTRPADVSLVQAEGPWRLVWATPAEAERGVFFFRLGRDRRYRLIDTWGGVIQPSERAETIAWARARAMGPPPRLAACFADALLAGR